MVSQASGPTGWETCPCGAFTGVRRCVLRGTRGGGAPSPLTGSAGKAFPVSAPHMTVVQKDAHIIYLTGLCWNVNEDAQRPNSSTNYNNSNRSRFPGKRHRSSCPWPRSPPAPFSRTPPQCSALSILPGAHGHGAAGGSARTSVSDGCGRRWPEGRREVAPLQTWADLRLPETSKGGLHGCFTLQMTEEPLCPTGAQRGSPQKPS